MNYANPIEKIEEKEILTVVMIDFFRIVGLVYGSEEIFKECQNYFHNIIRKIVFTQQDNNKYSRKHVKSKTIFLLKIYLLSNSSSA